MKKSVLLVTALASALALAGCATEEGNRAATGGLIGAATGAAIGGLATGRAGGALAGAVIGGAGGAIIGGATTPRRCLRGGYDYYGNPICLEYDR